VPARLRLGGLICPTASQRFVGGLKSVANSLSPRYMILRLRETVAARIRIVT
jgi:hypothetical protein